MFIVNTFTSGKEVITLLAQCIVIIVREINGLLIIRCKITSSRENSYLKLTSSLIMGIKSWFNSHYGHCRHLLATFYPHSRCHPHLSLQLASNLLALAQSMARKVGVWLWSAWGCI